MADTEEKLTGPQRAEQLQNSEYGWNMVVDVDGDEYVGLHRLMYHWMMIRGLYIEQGMYYDRWCYATLEKGLAALAEWKQRDWQGEPEGWHRHHKTGRRRPDGDASREYIAH